VGNGDESIVLGVGPEIEFAKNTALVTCVVERGDLAPGGNRRSFDLLAKECLRLRGQARGDRQDLGQPFAPSTDGAAPSVDGAAPSFAKN
jgi:hypothetical protein